MELKDYLHIIVRWIWFVLLCILLGAGSGYLFSRFAKPVYQATTKILVSPGLSDQHSQFAGMNTQQLIDTYVQLLSSTSVVNEASRRLNFQINKENLNQVQQVLTTPVIQIITEDSDPRRVAAIANMLVEVLMDQNTQASGYASSEKNIQNSITEVEGQISSLQTQYNQISNENLNGQLKQVNDQITTLQEKISILSSEIGSLTFSRTNPEQSSQLTEKQAELEQLQSLLAQYQQIRINLEYFGKPALNPGIFGDDLRLQLLQSKLDQYQKIYLDLLNELQTIQLSNGTNTSNIKQFEKATPPIIPVRPQPIVYTILAGIVGLVFAVGVIFISEYMDDSIKTPHDVQRAFGVPVLGYFPNPKFISKTKPGIKESSQDSALLNALRTNLEFAVTDPTHKTLLFLGFTESGEGKTRIVTDLATSYAQSGNRVILLDADLRNPSVHRYLGLDNSNGFNDLLVDGWEINAASKMVEGIEGLTVITAGNASPATEMLFNPDQIVQILNILQLQSDVIIINAPSIKDANSWVLASKVDGVLLMIQPRVTHLSEVRQAMEQLNRAEANILGVVLYHIPSKQFSQYKKV